MLKKIFGAFKSGTKKKQKLIAVNRYRIKERPLEIKRRRLHSFGDSGKVSPVEKKRNWLLGVGIALIFAIIIGLFYFCFLTPYFTIATVDLFEGEAESQNLGLRRIAASFRGQNLLVLSQNNVIERFLSTNKRLKSVNVTKDYPRSLKIVLAEIPPAVNLVVANGQIERKFILNDLGIVVSVDEYSDKLPEVYITSKDSLPLLNQEYMSGEFLSKLLSAEKIFNKTINLKIKRIIYLPVAREVHLQTENDVTIWLDLQKDLTEQIAKLTAALPKINIYDGGFEYIDLRIDGATGDRIVFKRR